MRGIPVVFDPVMVASSGDGLTDPDARGWLRLLAGRAFVVTPNLPELEALGGLDRLIAEGGHGEGPEIMERLVGAAGEIKRWSASRIETRHTHGTGCTLSSAIATLLGAGQSLANAVTQARAYVRATLLAAPALGRGHGPMGHGLGRAHFP